VPSFKTLAKGRPILQCFVQQIKEGVHDVTVDGLQIGLVQFVARPQIQNNFIEVYEATETKVEGRGVSSQLDCILKKGTRVVRSKKLVGVGSNHFCDLTGLEPGHYNLSLGIGS
jgi:hypothetical protein